MRITTTKQKQKNKKYHSYKRYEWKTEKLEKQEIDNFKNKNFIIGLIKKIDEI